jgi:hypothetical protein
VIDKSATNVYIISVNRFSCFYGENNEIPDCVTVRESDRLLLKDQVNPKYAVYFERWATDVSEGSDVPCS